MKKGKGSQSEIIFIGDYDKNKSEETKDLNRLGSFAHDKVLAKSELAKNLYLEYVINEGHGKIDDDFNQMEIPIANVIPTFRTRYQSRYQDKLNTISLELLLSLSEDEAKQVWRTPNRVKEHNIRIFNQVNISTDGKSVILIVEKACRTLHKKVLSEKSKSLLIPLMKKCTNHASFYFLLKDILLKHYSNGREDYIVPDNFKVDIFTFLRQFDWEINAIDPTNKKKKNKRIINLASNKANLTRFIDGIRTKILEEVNSLDGYEKVCLDFDFHYINGDGDCQKYFEKEKKGMTKAFKSAIEIVFKQHRFIKNSDDDWGVTSIYSNHVVRHINLQDVNDPFDINLEKNRQKKEEIIEDAIIVDEEYEQHDIKKKQEVLSDISNSGEYNYIEALKLIKLTSKEIERLVLSIEQQVPYKIVGKSETKVISEEYVHHYLRKGLNGWRKKLAKDTSNLQTLENFSSYMASLILKDSNNWKAGDEPKTIPEKESLLEIINFTTSGEKGNTVSSNNILETIYSRIVKGAKANRMNVLLSNDFYSEITLYSVDEIKNYLREFGQNEKTKIMLLEAIEKSNVRSLLKEDTSDYVKYNNEQITKVLKNIICN